MNRKQTVGLLIMSVMLMTYNHFMGRHLKKKESDNTQHVPNKNTFEESSDTKKIVNKQFLKIENDVFSVLINQYGARLSEVNLKKFTKHDNNPVVLLGESNSNVSQELSTPLGQIISLDDLIFELENDTNTAASSLQLIAKKGQETIKSTISLNDDYTVSQQFSLYNETGQKSALNYLSIVWDGDICYGEKDFLSEDKRTNIQFTDSKEKFYNLKDFSSTSQKKDMQGNLLWVTLKQRFFSSGIISNKEFILDNTHVEISGNLGKNNSKRSYKIATRVTPISLDDNKNIEVKYFFGPNDFKLLKKIAPKFHRNILLGWPVIRIFNSYLINPIYEFLTNLFSNAGIVIFLLIVIIKLLLLPLTYKAYISSSSMRLLKPALDEIKNLYKDDIQKGQIEQMKLYRAVGINPLSGFFIALVQMPILFSIFNFIPNQIGFRQKVFLWVKDLSTYDSICALPFSIPFYGNHVSLFAVLMTLSTIVQALSNVDLKSQTGPMKIMAYAMAVMFMFMFNSFPASLTFYYFASNLITFIIQEVIKKFVNEQEILKKLEANKKNRVKTTNPGFKKRFNDLLINGK